MGWRQVRSFNPAKGGTQKGLCLKNVRLGYEIASRFNDATEAWANTEQHRDRSVPGGVAVPLFYYYRTTIGGVTKNWGHINVQLPDGRVWSDGEYFTSITDYENKKAPTFIGWGESVNEVRVIQYVNDPAPAPSKMPPVGARVQLMPVSLRNTFRAGTTTVAGTIHVTDNSFIYTVRGYDAKYPNRILINSASAGGDGVALALYFTNGSLIPAWRVV